MNSQNSTNSAAATKEGGAAPNQTADDVQRRLATAVAATLAVRRANDAVNKANSFASPTESQVARFMAEDMSLLPVNTPTLSLSTHSTADGSVRPIPDVMTGGEMIHRRNLSTPPVIPARGLVSPSVATPVETTDGLDDVVRLHVAEMVSGNPNMGHSKVVSESELFTDPPTKRTTTPLDGRIATARSVEGLASLAQTKKALPANGAASPFDLIFGREGGVAQYVNRDDASQSGITVEEAKSLHRLSYLDTSKPNIESAASKMVLTAEDDDLLTLSDKKEVTIDEGGGKPGWSEASDWSTVTPVPVVLQSGGEPVYFPPEVISDVLASLPPGTKDDVVKALNDARNATDVAKSVPQSHPDVILTGPPLGSSDSSIISQLSAAQSALKAEQAALVAAAAEVRRLTALTAALSTEPVSAASRTDAEEPSTADTYDQDDSFISVDPSDDIQTAPTRLMTGDHGSTSMEGWAADKVPRTPWEDVESERSGSLSTEYAIDLVQRFQTVRDIDAAFDAIWNKGPYPKAAIEALGHDEWLQKALIRFNTAMSTGDFNQITSQAKLIQDRRNTLYQNLFKVQDVPSAAPSVSPTIAASLPASAAPSRPSSVASSQTPHSEGGGGGFGASVDSNSMTHSHVGGGGHFGGNGGDGGGDDDDPWHFVEEAAGGGGDGPGGPGGPGGDDSDDDDDFDPLVGRDCDVDRRCRKKKDDRGFVEEQAWLSKAPTGLKFDQPDAQTGLKVSSEKGNKGNASQATRIVDGVLNMMRRLEDLKKHLARRDMTLAHMIPRRKDVDTSQLTRKQLRKIPLTELFEGGLESSTSILSGWNERDKHDVMLYQRVTHSNHVDLLKADVETSHLMLKMLKRMWSDDFKDEVDEVREEWGLTESSDAWGGITALYITILITFRLHNHMKDALKEKLSSFSTVGLTKTPGEDVEEEAKRLKRLVCVLYQCRGLLRVHPEYIRKGFTLCSHEQFKERFLRLEYMSVEDLLQATRKHEDIELDTVDQAKLRKDCEEIIRSAKDYYIALKNHPNGWKTPGGKDISAFNVQPSTPSTPAPNCENPPPGVKCDNCGGPHLANCCDQPKDKDRMAKARKERLDKKKKASGGKPGTLPTRNSSGNVDNRAKAQNPQFNLAKNEVEQFCVKCNGYANHPSKYHEESKKPGFSMLAQHPDHPFSKLQARFQLAQGTGSSASAAPASTPGTPAAPFAGKVSFEQLTAYHAQQNSLFQEELKHGVNSVLGMAARTQREKLQSDFESVFRM